MSVSSDEADKPAGAGPEHPIFTKDPSHWMNLIHKHVCVTTEDDVQHKGWVYTIDPVSESIVLMNLPSEPLDSLNDGTISLQILIGNSITKIDALSPDISEDIKLICGRLFRPAAVVALSGEELLKQRTALKTWLEKHHIPVSVGGHDGQSLSVLSDALIIQPPYRADNCLSTNEIILSKVQGLVKAMPKI